MVAVDAEIPDQLGSGHQAFVMRYYTTTFTDCKGFCRMKRVDARNVVSALIYGAKGRSAVAEEFDAVLFSHSLEGLVISPDPISIDSQDRPSLWRNLPFDINRADAECVDINVSEY